MSDNDMVVMGRIVAPYGVFGWLKVVPDTESFDGLFDYSTWWVGKSPDWHAMQVETAKIHNDVLVVKLAGVDDRDAAFSCKGKQIAVPRAQLPAAAENEYYWSDLISLRVKNKEGVDFGLITDIFETGANDVLVIQSETKDPESKVKSQERLLPFIGSVVLEVDLNGKTMLVDWDEDF